MRIVTKKSRNSNKNLLFLLVALASFTSCTHYQQYPVTINAYSDRQKILCGFPAESTFWVSPKNNDYGNPLLYKEITEKLSRILENNGFIVASGQSSSDYVVYYDFKVDSLTKTVNVAHEISVPVPVQNIEQNTSVNFYPSNGIRILEAPGSRQQSKSSITNSTASTTVFVPEEQTWFFTDLSLYVYDSKKIAGDDYIWYGTSRISSRNADAREKIDYLLVSIFKYFGKNTDKNLSLSINERDDEVKLIRGELSPVEQK